MDRGFAGVVAVAVLGCAVILAIAFQISEGLAMEGDRRGGGPATAPRAAEGLTGAALEPVPASGVAPDGAVDAETGFGRESGAEQGAAESTPADASGLALALGLTSAPADARATPPARQGTPAAAKEINPAEGHTVSPQPADESGGRARKAPRRPDGQAGTPHMTASDRESSSAPATAASSGTPGLTAGETPPAIEMIRGTRRSTEPIAAKDNQD